MRHFKLIPHRSLFYTKTLLLLLTKEYVENVQKFLLAKLGDRHPDLVYLEQRKIDESSSRVMFTQILKKNILSEHTSGENCLLKENVGDVLSEIL